MNKRGEGWKGADQIHRLGEPRRKVLWILRMNGAIDEEHGMTGKQIGAKYRDLQILNGERHLSTDHGIGGRYSECQGAQLIESTNCVIELYDEKAQLRYMKTMPKYWLTRKGRDAPDDAEWDPQSGSEVITEPANYIGAFFNG